MNNIMDLKIKPGDTMYLIDPLQLTKEYVVKSIRINEDGVMYFASKGALPGTGICNLEALDSKKEFNGCYHFTSKELRDDFLLKL